MNIEREVQILNINDVLPNRFQPRITFDEKAIMELADSIKTHGVIQPIVVRRIADKYEIIAGERRYKASVIAGKTTIPAIVTDLDDKNSAEIALIENVQRRDLTPIEEAVSYKKILDMGYLNQAELATKLGKTQSTIANKLRLLNLTDEVQEALLNEKISERHARSLLKLTKNKQNEMLNRIISERMTVRKTDEEIAKITNNIEVLDFNKKEDNMNNQMNSFNMPTSSIIEPTMNKSNSGIFNPQPVQNVNLNQPEQETQINTGVNNMGVIPSIEPVNPGFMDISKIESEAQNINQVNTDLVTPFNIEGNNQVQPFEINATTSSDVASQGKFFTQSATTTETNNNNLDNIVIPGNNIFGQDISFAQQEPLKVEPVVQDNGSESQNNEFNPALASFGFGNNQNASIFNPNPVPNIEPVAAPTFNSNQSMVEIGGTGVISEETVLQPLMNGGQEVIKHDMKEAIQIIRNCSKEIEKLGFKLDVEEIDFENFYQATFKIDKD